MTKDHQTPDMANKNEHSAEGHLVHPADGAGVEGRSLLFRWDFHDLRPQPVGYRLVVKPVAAAQSPQEAFHDNSAAFDMVIDHDRHAAFGVERLKTQAICFAWQVTALSGNGSVLAVSALRTFRLDRGCTPAESAFTVDAQPVEDGLPERSLQGSSRGGECECCPNGGFESGDFTGWQGWYGIWQAPYLHLNSLTSGFNSSRHQIVSPGTDPYVPIPTVGLGNYSARIGVQNYHYREATGLSYTFTVTPQNKHFGFRYALVLRDGGHPETGQAFFSWFIKKGPSIFFSAFGSNAIITMSPRTTPDHGNPSLNWSGDIAYRNWTPVCVDLSAYVGQTVTIAFFAASCWGGVDTGHFGYAYIDGLCQSNEAVPSFRMPSEICGSATLWANGSASDFESAHFWSIEESDANWGRNPATEECYWFNGEAGNTNLTALYASRGKTFRCNTWYRIKLAVINGCTPWAETVQLVYIKCPPVTAGPDMCVSCTPNGQSVQLGAGNSTDPALTYLWSPAAGLDDPHSPSPSHLQGSVAYPATYTVTVADANGCRNSDQVTLYCQKPRGDITLQQGCCHATLTLHVSGGWNSITWSNGVTNVETISVTQPGIYTAAVGNGCGTFMVQITVPPLAGVTGPFNPVSAESKINPTNTSSQISPVMHIMDVVIGSPAGIAGVPGAYNATDYELLIFDRWGNLIRTILGSNCEGFTNWSIQWDGRNDNGTVVQQDTYSWRLRFKNCSRKDWEPARVRRTEKRCKKWFTVFGAKLWCTDWEYFYMDYGDGIGSVTVIH